MIGTGALGTFRTVLRNRRLLWNLALYELRGRYAATLAGSIWAIVNPLVLIAVFWFITAYGLKVSFESGPPYFLMVFCGIVPWLAFSEALSGGTNAILGHAFVVKKIAFPLEILPLVPIVTSVIVHFVLILVLLFIMWVSGLPPQWQFVQILYFSAAMLVFASALSYVLGPINVFQRDTAHVVGAVLTIWFWVTPVIWPTANLPDWAYKILRLNPVFYIVEGYRGVLLFDQPFWFQWPLDAWFWAVTLFMLLLGSLVFRRLKPHFGDVI